MKGGWGLFKGGSSSSPSPLAAVTLSLSGHTPFSVFLVYFRSVFRGEEFPTMTKGYKG